jgi:phosphate-selective porin OprO/OprP
MSIFGALILGAMVTLIGPAYAVNDAMLDLLKILRDKGSITEEEYEMLVGAAKADAEHITFAKEEIKRIDTETITTKDKLVFTSKDGDHEWQPIGRLMADYHVVDSDLSPIDTEGMFRRARLGMQGRMWKTWIWKAEYDFAAGADVGFKDVYVGYEGSYAGGKWNVKAGQHHIPFGLATMSSSKYLTLLERPLLADGELQPTRQLGISGFIHGGEQWTLNAGLFGAKEDPPNADPGTFEEVNLAARATWNPYIKDPIHFLHVGGAVWYKDPNDTELRVRQRPGTIRSSDNRFIDANFGTGLTDDVLAFNAEALAVWGKFHLQGEYTHWDVSPKIPTAWSVTSPGTVDLDGYYVEASYFLTGESMNFKTSEGVFSGVKPFGTFGKGGVGAWQVALRYEAMDLNDFVTGAGTGVRGGREEDFRIGLKWYPTPNLNFLADYVTVLDLDRPGSPFDGDEPGSFNFRAMVFW